MKKTTQSQFNADVLEKTGTVVVDAYTDWCPPCKALKPVLERMSTSCEGVDFLMFNAEDESELSVKYSISHLPTILIFKAGTLRRTLVGFQSEKALKEILDAI